MSSGITSIVAGSIGVMVPFPFYYLLWTYPTKWVELCGRSRDPCKVMAQVSHCLKLIQFISLLSVSTLSWPPPLYFWPLFLLGQFLNFRVYQLLGESGTYYGVRFGKNIPWVTEFPFGYISDPQYTADGEILWDLKFSGELSYEERRHTVYSTLEGVTISDSPDSIAWLDALKKHWDEVLISGVTSKINSFCWVLAHDRVPTQDNLKRRGFVKLVDVQCVVKL